MLIDTHAHLYSYEDVLRVVKDSADFGVETIVSISTDLATSKLNIDIASKIENVYSTVGVHPCDIDQY
ncbi:radical SAM protein, partial [bacterium]|nr:radical SAM protein [bacterium]